MRHTVLAAFALIVLAACRPTTTELTDEQKAAIADTVRQLADTFFADFRALSFDRWVVPYASEIVWAENGALGAGEATRGAGGVDIEPPLHMGVPGMQLNVDGTRYFWYHHIDADTLDKLDPDEMALCVATLAVMAYVVADLPEGIPR